MNVETVSLTVCYVSLSYFQSASRITVDMTSDSESGVFCHPWALFESLNSVEPSRIRCSLNPYFYSLSTKRESLLDLKACGTAMKFEVQHGCACLLKRGAGVKVEVKEEPVICEVNPAPALKLDPFSTLALCQSSVWKQMNPRQASRQGTFFGSVYVTSTFLSQYWLHTNNHCY